MVVLSMRRRRDGMVGTCTRDDSARAGMTRLTPDEARQRASLAGYA
jgi:hypothetical protein